MIIKMKRKRFDRDIWNFGDSPYYQIRIDTDGFHGLICLLKLMSGNIKIEDGNYQYWNLPKAGMVAVCGRGMTWMQLVPDGKRHALTVMYLPDNIMSICYIDIIENIEYDPDGVAVFIDKYLDVIFTPQGDVKIDDRDELDKAFEEGELSEKQYNAALNECDSVIKEYCSDIPKTVEMFNKILAYVNGRIENSDICLKSECK